MNTVFFMFTIIKFNYSNFSDRFNYIMTTNPDEPMDQNEPLSPTSNRLVDAPNNIPTSSTATTIIATATTVVKKTKAEVQREYRQRCKQVGKNLSKPMSGAKSNAQRQREYRQRKAANLLAKNCNQPVPMNQNQPIPSTSN